MSKTTYKAFNRLASTYLEAKKKKRRRRKEDTSASSTSSSSSQSTKTGAPPPTPILSEEDELPDFDLIEDIDLPSPPTDESASSFSTAAMPAGTTAQAPSPQKKKTIDPNDPAVLAAMQATKGIESMGTTSSTKDLLRSRDRELEQKLVVNEIVQDVPSFADYNARKGGSSSAGAGGGNNAMGGGMGKKAMKREQRRAAALEAEGKNADEEGEGVGQVLGQALSKLPFVEDKKEKSAIKLLEEGTWACIFLLVGWEIYINTPFFDRAAPMAPVVFQDPMTMTFLL